MAICRACLSTEIDLYPINETYVKKYNILTGLDIKLNKDLPIYSCNSCMDAMIFCIGFREKCISSDATLRETLISNETKKSPVSETYCEIDIKKEVKIEFEDIGLDFNDDFEVINYDVSMGKEVISEPKNEDLLPKQRLIRIPKINNDQPQVIVKKCVKVKKEKKLEPLVCGLCPKSFSNDINKLSAHLEKHKSIKNCEICCEEFLSYSHALSHRFKHVPVRQRRCYICNKRFMSIHSLEFHYMREHNFADKDELLKCKQCQKSFSTPDNVQKHMWSQHSSVKYTCDYCGKGYRQKNILRSHILHHREMNILQHKCQLCAYSTKHLTSYKNHMMVKHTECRVYCKNCGRVYANKEFLRKHKCKSTIDVCPICGVNTRRLTRHLKSHSDNYPYKCDKCDAKFKVKATYRVHLDKHEGIKRHRCEYCNKSFYNSSVLTKHRRIHTGERPYVCSICSKAFTARSNLKVHMRIHGLHLVVKKTDT